MKGSPAVPGGSLTSKPTWSNTGKVFRHVGFFVACSGDLARMNLGTSQRTAGQPGGKRTHMQAVTTEPW
jgi:hypothetical protein